MPKHSVMIVEDDPVSAKIAEKVVEQLGYRVLGVFRSGEEAVRSVAALAPDVVLMDIVLAGEMDGLMAARILTSRFDLPLIFLTSTTDEIIGRLAESGACGYIHKPVKLLDLKANLEMALSRGGGRMRRHCAQQRAVLEALPQAVMLVGADLGVRLANPAAVRFLGCDAESMEGRPASEVLAGLFELRPAVVLATALDGDHCGLKLAGSDGRDWIVTVNPARHDDGSLMGAVVGFRPEDAA